MNKLFCLAIVLVAYGPISAYADCALQKLAWVLANRETAELGQSGEYIATPKIWNDGKCKQYVAFGVRTKDKACDVYDVVVKYMANAVGNAKSSYKTCCGDCVTVVYEGDYDPSLKEPTKVQSLIEVLRTFPKPMLGGIECEVADSSISPSGFAYIALTVPSNGNDYQDQCNTVWSYLSENQYLDSDAKNSCYCDGSDSALLEIWSTNCRNSVQ